MPAIRGSRIRRLRESVSMSQADLARFTDISQGHLSKIERNQIDSVGSEILQTLAHVLQTNVDYLIGVSDDPRPADRPRDPGELDATEQQLVEMYRSLPDQTSRSIVLSTVRALVGQLLNFQGGAVAGGK